MFDNVSKTFLEHSARLDDADYGDNVDDEDDEEENDTDEDPCQAALKTSRS